MSVTPGAAVPPSAAQASPPAAPATAVPAAAPPTPADAGPAAAPARTPADDALHSGLRTLAGLLAEADMAATDCFADLALAPHKHWRAQLEPLAAPMAALDFGTALAVCRKLLARLEEPAIADEGAPR